MQVFFTIPAHVCEEGVNMGETEVTRAPPYALMYSWTSFMVSARLPDTLAAE